ncbi:QcrA and Rieske domain-containing protein [Pseudonocardia sp. T1-2H]|uniref:QcrA and Rieske domain-containing protein n=1 Tax=Pseudonocardia sp. T1-2H TaxID=3128899 RepID=UPI0031012427
MRERGLGRYVEDLLRGRRPRRFRAEPSDIADLRTAIGLRAARPGSDVPREEFVADLHRRLAADLADVEPTRSVAPLVGRRRMVAQGAAIAAAAAAGAVVDHTLTAGRKDAGPDTGRAADTLMPTHGDWRTVAASDQVPDGAVRAFDLGTVTGFVQRTDGAVRAVSGSCTHQGCRLQLDATSRRLDCPCHTTVFAVTGELLTHQLPVAPAPLPQFATREVDGAVQVYAPPAAT